MEAIKKIEFTKVKNDFYGNPRYVYHFLDIPGNELDYESALKKAKTIGGKKFSNKQYGGGIVFQSYNIQDLEKGILSL